MSCQPHAYLVSHHIDTNTKTKFDTKGGDGALQHTGGVLISFADHWLVTGPGDKYYLPSRSG